MGYKTVRATKPVRHNNVLRVPGQTTGENAQDFVVSDASADRLVALGVVTVIGVADEPEVVEPVGRVFARKRGGVVIGLQDESGLALTSDNPGGTGAELDWITEDGVVVGLSGPNGEDFAVLRRQPDGSILAEITPRTGTLDTLLGLSGGVGEIASATDQNASVVFNGVAGEAISRDGVRTHAVAGTGEVTLPVGILQPNVGTVILAGPATGVTAIAGALPDAWVDGMRLTIINETGCALTVTQVSSAEHTDRNGLIQLVWTGARWEELDSFAADKLAPFQSWLDDGVDGDGTYLYSTGLTNASAPTSLNSTAMGNKALAAWPNEFARQAVPAITGTYDAQISTVVLGGRSGSATPVILGPLDSFRGETAARLHPNWTGFRYCEITITGHVGTVESFIVMKRGFCLKSTGTVMTLFDVHTLGTDRNYGLVGGWTPACSLVIGANGDLEVSVTGTASTIISWAARLEMNCSMVGGA